MNAVLRYVPLLIVAAAWEAASRLGLVSSLALPPLSDVIASWIDLLRDGDLLTNAGPSLYRLAAGLALAIVVGALLGLGMAWWKPVNVVLAPVVEIFYPLPKSALIPVTAIWLGFGDGSKILLIFLGCMIPVTIAAFNGARGCDRMLLWSARSMGASRLRVLWDVVLPGAMPELLNGIRTAIALSFILLVSSELIVAAITGKTASNTTIVIFEVSYTPSHRIMTGRKAIFGIGKPMEISGSKNQCTSFNRDIAMPSAIPPTLAMAKPISAR